MQSVIVPTLMEAAAKAAWPLLKSEYARAGAEFDLARHDVFESDARLRLEELALHAEKVIMGIAFSTNENEASLTNAAKLSMAAVVEGSVNGPGKISASSISRALAGLCPLFPFC